MPHCKRRCRGVSYQRLALLVLVCPLGIMFALSFSVKDPRAKVKATPSERSLTDSALDISQTGKEDRVESTGEEQGIAGHLSANAEKGLTSHQNVSGMSTGAGKNADGVPSDRRQRSWKKVSDADKMASKIRADLMAKQRAGLNRKLPEQGWRGAQGESKLREYVPPELPGNFWQRPNSRFYFKYIINVPQKCNPGVDILLMTLTAPENGPLRDEARRTWAQRIRLRDYVLEPLFLLGQTSNVSLALSIRQEAEKYHDIIQANFTDSYRNLTYKTLSGLNWARTYCSKAKMVYKVDDDTPNAHRSELYYYVLKKEADRTPLNRAMVCLYPGFEPPYNEPKRNSSGRWYVSEQDYPESFYPYMCMGSGGYVVTMDAVQDLIEASHRTRPLWLEDVYVTGILRTLAGNITIEEIPNLRKTRKEPPKPRAPPPKLPPRKV